MTRLEICTTMSWGGVPTRAAISSSFGYTAIAAIAPTAAVLARFLLVSTARGGGWRRFLIPAIGFSFENAGLIALGVGLKPTWATEAITPAKRQTAITGKAASATCWPTSQNSVPTP